MSYSASLQTLASCCLFILITTLEILMAVRVYLNNLQIRGYFTLLEVCLSTTVLYVYEVHSWAVYFSHNKEWLLPYTAIIEWIYNLEGVCFLHSMIPITLTLKRGKFFWGVTSHTSQDGYEYFRRIPFTSIHNKAWLKRTGYP